MRARLLPCPACKRHVRADDVGCPFCGASLPDSFRSGEAPPRPAPGLSRAGLFAYGARVGGVMVGVGVLVGACDRGPSPSPSDPGSMASAYGAAPPPIEADAQVVDPSTPPDAGVYASAYGAPFPRREADAAPADARARGKRP